MLFLFLDGVGIGPPDPERNPFLRAEVPRLRQLLGGAVPTLADPERSAERAEAFPLDAALGVDGLPQSGTGQTSLLTGRNAPRMFGRHFGPWTPVRLRPVLEEENLLRRARDAGLRVAFANAHPRGYPDSRRARAVPPVVMAARAAGLVDRHGDALARGDAVAAEIVNDAWRTLADGPSPPRIDPDGAGANLARIARAHDLTLFAHYATDRAGHRAGMKGGVAALERLDRFLGGVLDALDPRQHLVIASDHGNLEDVTAGHTRNPVLGVIVGPDAAAWRRELGTILDLAPALLDRLTSGRRSGV